MGLQISREKETLKMELSFLSNPELRKPVNTKNLPPPKKPLVLTRENIKSKVFGLGYPSAPTISVEEYAEMEMRKLNPNPEFAIWDKERKGKFALNNKNKEEDEEKEEE